MDSTLNQGYIFLYAAYGGIVIGAVYDILFIIRRICHEHKWMGVLLDLVFCVFAAGLILAVLYKASAGQIHLFSLAGFVLGFCLYTWGLRRLLRGIVRRLFKKKKSRGGKNKGEETKKLNK